MRRRERCDEEGGLAGDWKAGTFEKHAEGQPHVSVLCQPRGEAGRHGRFFIVRAEMARHRRTIAAWRSTGAGRRTGLSSRALAATPSQE